MSDSRVSLAPPDGAPLSGPTLFETRLGRRRFLYLAGGLAAYGALAPHRSWAAKVAANAPSLQPWRLPNDPPADPLEMTRALIGAAVLAPSKWNTQPWRFEVEGNSIRITADTRRTLPVIDPDRRSMMMSLGASLENLLVAARAYGLRPTVSHFPSGAARDVVAEVTWANGEARRDRAMLAAIPNRRTNRKDYDARGIFPQNRAQITAQIPEGFALHWIDDEDGINAVADLVHDAVDEQVRDPRAQSERYTWMRFGDDEARRRGDGVTVDSLEIGGLARWMAGRYFNPDSWFIRFGAPNAAKRARGAVRSSGTLALLTATGGRGEQQWLTGGQAFERVALKATQVGIAHHAISTPFEVPRFRVPVLQRFGAGGEEPLLLVRFGHARQPVPSVRRAVNLVSTFRNS